MAIPAFTDDEITLVRLFRNNEIRVSHDGRLTVYFILSDEYAAAQLHNLLHDKESE